MSDCDEVSVKEIAQRLSVKPQTVHQWRHRYSDFPSPLKVLGHTPIWEWNTVAEWVERRRKK